MIRMRVRIPTWAFLLIAQRDRWICHVCGNGYRADDPWQIDHDTALSKGGTNHMTNLRLAHRGCNHDKADA